MNKRILIYFFLAIIFINSNCKNNNIELNILNTTFVGVVKYEGAYRVYDRCDGAFPLLQFKSSSFYFYNPQEGAYYTVKDIKKDSNKYIINTDGYFNIEGDNIIKQNNSWELIKKDNLIWEFKNMKWSDPIILTDTINLSSKKIEYIKQPCKECFEDCDEKDAKKNNYKIDNDINIIGNWNEKCDNEISTIIVNNINSAYIDIYLNNDYARVSIDLHSINNTFSITYSTLTGITRYNNFIDWVNISHDSIIGNIELVNNDEIKLNWYGFYNCKSKNRELLNIGFKEPFLLKRCKE